MTAEQTAPIDFTPTGTPVPAADTEVIAGNTARPRRAAGLLTGLMRNRKAAAGAFILLSFVLIAIFAPFIAQYDPTDYVDRPNRGPSADHWFGTTGSGQDVFSQTVYGARVSLGTGLVVGVAVTVV